MLASRLSRLPGVYAAVAPASPDYQAGGTALITVLPAAEAGEPAGQRTVATVRNAIARDPAVAGVGGVGAEIIDFTAATYGNLWKMLALIALVTFALLAVAFRSLLLPVKAIALNFAAVAAATGVLVFVWQEGHGSDTLWQVRRHRRRHVLGAGVLVRLLVRAIDGLRGLHLVPDPRGIPGHRVHARRGGRRPRPHRQARQQRRADPGAGVPGHVQRPATAIKLLATGLGAGILIDATIIRCLLVPVLVALFGRWNWWLPARPVWPRKRLPARVPAPANASLKTPGR